MSMVSIQKPEKVFQYFEKICSIPHGSRNVEKISNYLVSFAKEHGLKYRQDEKYNVIIWKDGSTGYEQSEPLIIQGHMDMVAVKTADCEKNLETDGLDLEIDGDYLQAKGTSLGGDDGIAVAYALAILAAGCIILFIVSVLQERGMKIRESLAGLSLPITVAIYFCLLASIGFFGSTAVARGFIYAQF